MEKGVLLPKELLSCTALCYLHAQHTGLAESILPPLSSKWGGRASVSSDPEPGIAVPPVSCPPFRVYCLAFLLPACPA